MSEWRVEVVRVGPVQKHPNADSLSITHVAGSYPVIMRTGEYAEGDLAVYVPVDSLVPEGDPRWEFLGLHRRIRAKRLRGTFSMGLLTKADPAWTEGQDVAAALNITKYVEDANELHEDDEPDPGLLPVYDIEALRRYPNALVEGEEVVLTEKIHGENARYVHDGERLWCASRTRFKREHHTSQWWRAAARYNLGVALADAPHIGFYGEVHGYTGGFPYGVEKGSVGLRFFDAIDTRTRRWLDHQEFVDVCHKLSLPTVPVLYRGPWSHDLRALAEGNSTLSTTPHVREGFVVRPVKERRDDTTHLGRVLLKLHGEGFLTRK